MAALLADRIALVVGASSGIGKAIAIKLASNGAKVVVASRRKSEGEKVVADIEQLGGEALFITADVTSTDSIKNCIQQISNTYGGIDIAVNNAGIEGTTFVPTADYDEETFDAVINTNVTGVWRCMKYQIPQLNNQGVIVNMSSIAGLRGNEMMGCAYTASKHAIIGLTKTAAREYAPKGIRINAVCPGVIKTEIAERSLLHDEKLKRRVEKLHPIGRLGTVDEVAESVLWLVSDQSSFMTGHAMVLDGGVTA